MGTNTCDADRAKIEKSIAATKKKQRAKQDLKDLVNVQARGAYEQCEYGKALKLLDQALGRVSCESDRAKIAESMAATEKKQQEEQRINNGVQQALSRHQSGGSEAAARTLESLLAKSTCKKTRSTIEEAIVTVQTAEPPTPEIRPEPPRPQGATYTCEIREYRDRRQPNRAGTSVHELNGNHKIFHVSNNEKKLNELMDKAGYRGIMRFLRAGTHYSHAVESAKQSCEEWRKKNQWTDDTHSAAPD